MIQQTKIIRLIFRAIALFLVLAGLYAGGLAIRRVVVQTQIEAVGGTLPFTLESALHFRRVKMMFDRGFLPEVDPAIQHPEGINIREIDSVASEPVQAFFAAWFPDEMPFADRIRWIEAGWFCLSIPLLAVAIRVWTGSWLGGFLAAALYAFSMASVLRSTGQEISRENFAFPWLIASFACAAANMKLRDGWWAAAVSAACLAFALIGWDMIQYVVGLITLAMSLHVIRASLDRRVLILFIAITAAVLVVGSFHPYYRFHGLAWSPLMVWMVSVSAAGILALRKPGPKFQRAAMMVVPVALVFLLGLTGAYGASYNHFAELLWAKIRFLNAKPADPGMLTFYQRIMWVPALHSATWELTRWMFPVAFFVVSLITVVAWFDSRKQPDPLVRCWILFFVVSVIAFVLFVRFHVFVGLAVAIGIGWAAGRMARMGWTWQVVALALFGLVTIVEARHVWTERERMGRPNLYYEEMHELAEYLREKVAPQPVLANMGISAYIAAYAKCPIAIHPKFEDPTIRQRMQRYGEIMFGGDERTLRDWMDGLQVEYLVYSKGEFAAEKPEYQMRYFVDRLNPPDTVPARRFERDDESLRYFTRLWGNRKYVVYQVLGQARETEAGASARSATGALVRGDLQEAEMLAVEALRVDRHNEEALKVMRHVGSLMEQGVTIAPANE